jgi:hypothetical protein
VNLSTEESALFFKLWFSLLAYANRHLQVVPGIVEPKDIIGKPHEQPAKIRDALVEHPDLLEGFIAENPQSLSPEDLAIVSGWRHWVPGEFFVVRFLKLYTVFLSSKEPGHLYGVTSLYDPLEEVLGGGPLPIYIQALLLPFRQRIIYDGIIMFHSIYFGPGIRAGLNESYNKLKECEGIIEQLVDSSGQPQIRTSLDRQKPRKSAPDWRPVVAEIVAQAEKMRQADTKVQSAAFSLLRAAAAMAQSTLAEPSAKEEHIQALRQVNSALTRLEKLLY